MELLRARAQLGRVRTGATLVRRKREALVAHLFRLARPAIDARAAIEHAVTEAYPVLHEALAVQGHHGLRALGWPGRKVEVEVTPAQIWGEVVADIRVTAPLRRTLDARGMAPASTGPAAAEAAFRFEKLAELLLEAAPQEMRVARLAAAVAQTSRQLNVLERRVEPALVTQVATIRRALEEREREERLALKHLQRKRRSSS
jgi:H(+)-transporting ATP synthase subunit D